MGHSTKVPGIRRSNLLIMTRPGEMSLAAAASLLLLLSVSVVSAAAESNYLYLSPYKEVHSIDLAPGLKYTQTHIHNLLIYN